MKKNKILIYGLSFLTLSMPQVNAFNTKNESKYNIFVWHACTFIWDRECYKEIVPSQSTSQGWYYDDSLTLCVGICDFEDRTTCNNAYWYGYPDNNDYTCCTVPPHAQQVVQIDDPDKPPQIVSGCAP